MDICCAALSAALGYQVSFPGQGSYSQTESSYWSIQEAQLAPACVVTPATGNDVASAVSIIAANEGCNFAIKGQGHAPAAGFANIDGGVTIDMSGMNSVSLSSDQSLASVGAGAAWLNVYETLDPFNVSVAGGRNGLVGVGGLLVGGGISHFSPRVGWACDNVVNYELVLGNGVLTNANQTFQSDLYRALKGGANNLGVVTRFDLSTFPQGNLSVTHTVNSIEEREAMFAAFTDITNATEFDIYTSLVMGLLYNSTSKSWLFSNSAVYTKPVLHPTVFDEIVSIPSISNSSQLTGLSSLAAEAPTSPLNWLFATATFDPSTELMLETFDILNETLSSFNPSCGVVWSIAFEPLPSVIFSHSRKTGGNILGLGPRDGNAFVLLVAALWPNSSSSATIDQVAQDAVFAIKEHASSRGLLRQFEYLNYAAPYQAPISSYGEENVAFLRRTSERYDPTKIFQHRVKGGFKIP
ncbi:FAD-binding domain-containing protein [Thozetella sp. PMI_491]|nr:FAD-binding domain-containing protein [Thozetella sp. PMI_491]